MAVAKKKKKSTVGSTNTTTKAVVSPAIAMHITNAVWTFWCGSPLNAHDVCSVLPAGKLGKSTFPAVVVVLLNPDATACLFDSGQVVITGAKERIDALVAAHKLMAYLRRQLNIPVSVFNFRIQNIAATESLGYELNLDLFLADHPLDASWPDNFAGLNWRTYNPDIMFVLFKTGNILAAGFTDKEDLVYAIERSSLLRRYALGAEYKHIPVTRRRTRAKPLESIEHLGSLLTGFSFQNGLNGKLSMNGKILQVDEGVVLKEKPNTHRNVMSTLAAQARPIKRRGVL
jgi:TATA-box binding protein (TBP) (component of TFIID and TFIIIB)